VKLSPHRPCLARLSHFFDARCPAFAPFAPICFLLHNRFLSTWKPNSFLAMFIFPLSNFVCSYIFRSKASPSQHPAPPSIFKNSPATFFDGRPNHVWFLPLSPGYVVQGCMHLHYCREVTCPFPTVSILLTPRSLWARTYGLP
jgi:hypothetical protein